MSRRCPACGRTWPEGAGFCGACGALLDTPEDTGTTDPARGRGRQRIAAATVVAVVAVGAFIAALPAVDLPGVGSSDLGDDTVALPTAPGTSSPGAPTGQAGPIRCTRARVPVDCLAWDVDAGGTISLGPRLPGAGALVDGQEDQLTVRDPETGEVVWSRDGLGDSVPLMVVDDVLVLGGRDQPVRGVRLDDGEVLWSAAGLQGVGSLPHTDPAVVVLGRRAPRGPDVTALVGVDPTTGTVRWEWTPGWSGTVQTALQPAGATGVLATGNGRLARLDVATGTTVWEVETLPDAYLQAHASGYVSAQQLGSSADPHLWIHDMQTGAVAQQMSATRIATHLVVDGTVVVHAPSEGVVRGMDLRTGESRWRVLLDGAGALGYPVTAADGGEVVVLERDAGRVTRIDPTSGAPTWEARLQRSAATTESTTFFGQPMLVDDVVVVEDTSSVVTVLDVTTGEERVRVGGDPQLDVRSLEPLTLVQGSRWMRVEIPPAGDPSGQ